MRKLLYIKLYVVWFVILALVYSVKNTMLGLANAFVFAFIDAKDDYNESNERVYNTG